MTKKKKLDTDVLNSIARRALYFAARMIYEANNRKDKEKGDPKIGGHASACASALHIMGALHLVMRSGFDHVANKPHASPTDHSYHYLLDVLLRRDLSRLSLEEANTAMAGLRKFPQSDDEYVFQSYHSAYDPDHHNFFPSGTVGIPPVMAGYLAHAYRYATEHGDFEVPQAHFWAVLGDSEFREGSLFEAVPEFAEREIGNLTWILDYNRQSLDGHRITNIEAMKGNDDMRVQRTMEANGWEVIQVRHGKIRQELFDRKGGDTFKEVLENDLTDYQWQVLLNLKEAKEVRKALKKYHKKIDSFLKGVDDEELMDALHAFGGHDFEALIEAMEASKKDQGRPTLIIAHTIKGWGLSSEAVSGNHNMLPTQEEVERMKEEQGISGDMHFARFDEKSPEGKYLKKRGEELYGEIVEQNEIKARNQEKIQKQFDEMGSIPDSIDVNYKMASYPHTQWMLGQLTSKLTRVANTPLDESKLAEKQKPLNDKEKAWKTPAELIVSMAPDVGTSTNLNPTMDGKVYGANVTEDYEAEFNVKDAKSPDLVPGHEANDRFLRFEIVEANTMSCMGAYGRLRDVLGIPILPLMTIYDFFVKRALDQYFYDLYWKSSFIMVGTPSGVTLSPEGAQHGWKSDIQIPNQITWEPYFLQELDWILSDSIRRHMLGDNEGRNGVHIRNVTRGAEQKNLTKLLKAQRRFKQGLSDGQLLHHKNFPMEGAVNESEVAALSEAEMFQSLREDVLQGGYYLIDYRGYAGYEPGDNVVHIFAMGALGTEAIEASQELLKKGIYANVIIVTSPDLLVGNLAHDSDYQHLKNNLQVTADLYLQPQLNGNMNSAEVVTLSGRRIPIVSVHDGEMGLLDNIGSIVGVRQEALGVRKHSRCGRPKDIYRYHNIDTDSIIEAAGKVLAETALENIQVSRRVLTDAATTAAQVPGQENWKQYWPYQQ